MPLTNLQFNFRWSLAEMKSHKFETYRVPDWCEELHPSDVNLLKEGGQVMDDRYEVRLIHIEGAQESVVESRELPPERLEQQIAELPTREAMSLVSGNVAAPINLALALNALSDNSTAIA